MRSRPSVDSVGATSAPAGDIVLPVPVRLSTTRPCSTALLKEPQLTRIFESTESGPLSPQPSQVASTCTDGGRRASGVRRTEEKTTTMMGRIVPTVSSELRRTRFEKLKCPFRTRSSCRRTAGVLALSNSDDEGTIALGRSSFGSAYSERLNRLVRCTHSPFLLVTHVLFCLTSVMTRATRPSN